MSNFKWGLVTLLGSLACVGGFGFLWVFCAFAGVPGVPVFGMLMFLAIATSIGGPIYFWAIRPLWQRARRS